MLRSLVGSEMCIRDSINAEYGARLFTTMATDYLPLAAVAEGDVQLSSLSTRGVSTTASTWLTLFKAIVGTGMIALPPAVKTTGWVLAPICVAVMCVLSLYTMSAIIRSVRAIREEMGDMEARIEWLELSERLGPWQNMLSSFSVISCQLGSCVAYVVFILLHCTEVIDVDVWLLAAILMLAAIPLALLRGADKLTFVSVLGNITLIVAIVTVYEQGFRTGDASRIGHGHAAVNDSKLVMFKPSGLAQFFGVALFMFSAHAECIPVEQSMMNKSQFRRVLVSCFMVIAILYLQFGLVVYYLYGDQTGKKPNGDDGTIFDNMGNGVFVDIVKITMSGALFAQFPITLLPASIMIESLCGIAETPDPQKTVNADDVEGDLSSGAQDHKMGNADPQKTVNADDVEGDLSSDVQEYKLSLIHI
eukprot:TRINITY_DN4148_c0_g1_i3.p1 TRINITY_DN4148_c0_g1~~TRINITY_DN4148_c0_g1_i3.p1  ORF type:complete len:419 (+),score=132.63 TRINITY_DN4148_c0_g1_i3:91-1347(+)